MPLTVPWVCIAQVAIIQAITNYMTSPPAYLLLFEAQNYLTMRKTTLSPQVLTMSDLRKTLHKGSLTKAVGPDNISGHVLRECADQMTDLNVLNDIFNISLSTTVISMCLKTTTIITMPKKLSVSCLNDYHFIALIPIIVKCFERLTVRLMKSQLT